jgi:carboxymethylenebutenolidase
MHRYRHRYRGASHGFHDDTTPGCDEVALAFAWWRTIEFFGMNLV